MARLQSVGARFEIAAQASLAETHRLLVATAKAQHSAVMKADPRPGSFRRWVDGREGAPEDSVKPTGVILYVYDRLEEVVRFAMDRLFANSPVRSGAYRSSHTLFLNGAAVRNLRGWKEGDEVAISNTVPYARKIELGVMRMRVPATDHVYERSHREVRRRFGNVASIDFGWRGISGPSIVGGAAGRVSAIRYPAMIITSR